MAGATTAFSTAGTELAISTTRPGTYDEAGFEALTFTRIGEVTDFPALGTEYNVIEHKPVAERVVIKLKGTANHGDGEYTAAFLPGDLGHQKLQIGLDSDSPVAFCETYQDRTKDYFEALVTAYKPAPGNVDSITSCTFKLVLPNKIIRVLP